MSTSLTVDLSGQTALVTGASAGLGRHFAEILVRSGARVAVAARRLDRVRELEKTLAGEGGQAMAVAMDVTKPESVAEALDIVETEFGTPDILINNAGVAGSSAALEVPVAEWDLVLDTNLKGAWTVAQQTARRMREAGVRGSIVNIASILGFGVSKGVAPYAISKAGVIHMTKCLALELARHGIRVNALAPGYVETDINRDYLLSDAGQAMIKALPQRRVGRPEELDGAILLLASDASSYMTGSIITVDGGHLVSSL